MPGGHKLGFCHAACADYFICDLCVRHICYRARAFGPQTGLSRFQNQFHDAFGISAPLFTDQQIEDDIFLTATASARKTYHLSSNVTLRPFVEAQFGADILAKNSQPRPKARSSDR